MGRLYAYAADEFRHTKPLLSLYMGFSDETEVAMITIDEATASRDYTQRRYWFAFLSKFDNFSRALTAKKPAEKSTCFVLIFRFRRRCVDLIENGQQNWRSQVPTVQRPASTDPVQLLLFLAAQSMQTQHAPNIRFNLEPWINIRTEFRMNSKWPENENDNLNAKKSREGPSDEPGTSM